MLTGRLLSWPLVGFFGHGRIKLFLKIIFQKLNDLVWTIHNFIGGINSCSTKSLHHNIQPKETIYIGWKNHPAVGWIKLNSNGTCKGGGEIAGCGGLFRNFEGRWIKSYINKIGAYDTLHVEMWGIPWFGYGLKGLRRVLIISLQKVTVRGMNMSWFCYFK